MSNNIRQNFYQGQNILAKDLNALQDYSDTNKNLLVSELLGSGILHGFEITKKEGFTISISPGVAFDKNGTRLILEKITDIDLTPPITAITDKRLRPILLGIKHSYIESDFVKDSVNKEIPIVLTPSVEIITGENLDEEIFQLASITLDENAIIAITTIKNKFSYHQHIKDLLYPINYHYTQYPNDTTGVFDETETPLALFGGTWEKLFTSKSVFFRTEGAGSKSDRVDGIQLDAMQKMTGSFYGVRGVDGQGSAIVEYGSLQEIYGGTVTNYINAPMTTSVPTNIIKLDNSLQVRTSEENRPTNGEVIVWKRVG